MKKIIFRADGNLETGLGHLYRIFALISIYSKKYTCILITREYSPKNIIPAEIQVKIIPDRITTELEPDWLNKNYDSDNHILVADGYYFVENFQKRVKELGYYFIYIDDLNAWHQYADVVINHAPGIDASNYNSTSYTKFALGPKYAILRKSFLEAAKKERKIPELKAAFVCFGGSDQFNFSLMATIALLSIKKIKKINVLLGASYNNIEIFNLQKNNSKVQLFQNIEEDKIVQILNESDFAISSSSNILYEICCIKMPIIAGYYIKNQILLYEGCKLNGLIFEGGSFLNFKQSDFKSKILSLIKENNYQKYITAQNTIFDSKIEQRLLNLTYIITYRKAESKDMELIFNLSNDQTTRENSFSSALIDIEAHKIWFEKKLIDQNTTILIAELENKILGIVRFEEKEEYDVIGILVAEEFRGNGLAEILISNTTNQYIKKNCRRILAFIKSQNLASIKSFKNAGYKFLKKNQIQGQNCLIYSFKIQDV